MASMNTRLNIEKLNENIIQKHGGSKQVRLKKLGSKQVGFKQLGHKQVGFKQLGPIFETGVHRVHDKKCVWFEVKLQGAQRNRETKDFWVSNDDTAVAQRQLEDKQPEERTNTDCLVKEQEKVHLGIKVGEDITVTGVPDQEGRWKEEKEIHCRAYKVIDHIIPPPPPATSSTPLPKDVTPSKVDQLWMPTSFSLNESYDDVESFIQQNDPVLPFYEARSRLVLEETRKNKQVANASIASRTTIVVAAPSTKLTLKHKNNTTFSSNFSNPSPQHNENPNRGRGRNNGSRSGGRNGGRGRRRGLSNNFQQSQF
ncbi:hypothetical protein Tco_0948534 [Tanacetum coccineum]